MEKFTWVESFEKISNWLLNFKNKRQELIQILINLGIENGLHDDSDKSMLLEEIDPFSFIAQILKNGEKKRNECLKKLNEQENLNFEIPNDYNGVPNVIPLKTNLFSYKVDRKEHDISILWELFEAIHRGDELEVYFNNALEVKQTAIGKLTQMMFVLFPNKFFPLDGQTEQWLIDQDILSTNKKYTWKEYENVLISLTKRLNYTYPQISFRCWFINSYELNAENFENLLVKFYKRISNGTDKIKGFINKSNKSLALEIGSKHSFNLIVEQKLECELNITGTWRVVGNSNLNKNAPNLAGKEVCVFKVNNEKNSWDDVLQIIDAYDGCLININKSIDSFMEKHTHIEDNGEIMKDQNLNRILFGAAGTGKTFHTINHALSIIENKALGSLEKEDRIALKKRFDEYKDQGQIKFVTFHQSFSYEDFVEGIRAESQKDEMGKSEITYPIVSGVFKSICSIASEGAFDSTTTNYEGLINIVIDNLLNKLKNDELVALQTKTGKKFSLHQGSSDKNIIYRTTSGYSNSISIESVKKQLMLELEERKTHPVYEPKLVEALEEDIKKIMRKQNPLKKPHVLIIDEINRGNISRIFGELITLIEDSKRQGAEEELSVTLPYSKEEFSVPSNVYIIGTMNSSDRSLTGLDIALRRRFTFVEMPPQPKEIKYKNGELIKVSGKDKNGNDKDVIVADILSVMNQRIEVLLDRDHCIGHANFMGLKKQPTLEHLASIFKQKIIPQLQEYFFDDWAKINMVLNANGMLEPKAVERSVLFPNVNIESEGAFEDQKTWQIVETTFDSIDSFAKIIRH